MAEEVGDLDEVSGTGVVGGTIRDRSGSQTEEFIFQMYPGAQESQRRP